MKFSAIYFGRVYKCVCIYMYNAFNVYLVRLSLSLSPLNCSSWFASFALIAKTKIFLSLSLLRFHFQLQFNVNFLPIYMFSESNQYKPEIESTTTTVYTYIYICFFLLFLLKLSSYSFIRLHSFTDIFFSKNKYDIYSYILAQSKILLLVCVEWRKIGT